MQLFFHLIHINSVCVAQRVNCISLCNPVLTKGGKAESESSNKPDSDLLQVLNIWNGKNSHEN